MPSTNLFLRNPDIDTEPSPDALAAARDLIAAEQGLIPPPSPSRLPAPSHPSSTPSFSPAIQIELDRIASATPLAPLALDRYEAQEAPPPSAASLSDLLAVLDRAAVSDAYLAARAQNLALLDAHGRPAWLLANHLLEAHLRRLERDLADTRRDIDRVNIDRQRRQDHVRAEMLSLDASWRAGVSKVLETELATEDLKQQIRDRLRAAAAAQGTQVQSAEQ